ncbi:MAG: DNA translocase FtsK [Oscillibacter sp.]|nr:DNA translocase FtsK [Oscillibacter sp.]
MVDLIRRRLVYGEEYDDWDQEPEDDGWTHPRVQVIQSDEDTQRVSVRPQFDFPLDEEETDSAAGIRDGGGDWQSGRDDISDRDSASDRERRTVRRNPPRRGLFSAFQGEASRLFGDRRGGRGYDSNDGYDDFDDYDNGGAVRTRDAALGSNFRDADSVQTPERGTARRSASGIARRGASAADDTARNAAGGPGVRAAEKLARAEKAEKKTTDSGAASPDTAADAELDPRKARAAASREVAAQAAAVSQEIAQKMDRPERKYRYPNLNNLYENKSRNYVEAGAELRGNSRRLADTLNSFGVEATPGDVVHGPAVTRYEYTLEQGVKLSKITNLADDIALALGATGVRIAPIPTKSSVVGIEVPNRQVTPVLIRDVVASQEFRNHPSTTAFALGKDIGGKNIVGCIEQLPHVLIAGTTGSGKSVCTNSLIISMLYHARPDQVRFIMVDPKMVELAPYNGIPHLLIPVVTDPKKAAGALQWATVEMMKRYRTFSEHGVKKLAEYNKAADAQGLEPMPSIVVVIDELADLMMAAAKEVEESIVRMAQMGRAAGMHLVIATQRPSADVITGLMKANIPSRIAFAVASAMESRIILDTPGAEKLVGKGDMLYAPLGESRIRVQGCYISPEEIERVVSFVKQTSEASYDNDVIAKIEATVQEKKLPEQMTIPEPPQEADELLPAAVEVVLETGQASVSMLQRRLKLGYSRAARLVDQMEEKGYVGPFEGSKPRQLLLTQEKWQEMKLAQSTAGQ